jgi:hypothetical protein
MFFPTLSADVWAAAGALIPNPHHRYAKIASNGVSHRTYLRRLEGRAFETSRRRDVKLLFPLATLAGALGLLLNSWAGASLSYL